ncbi:MAG: hypothetical protein M1546_19985 [Chloroflexi bacterium]|nr:hypothetical protein [Chloroflexota bacterium]
MTQSTLNDAAVLDALADIYRFVLEHSPRPWTIEIDLARRTNRCASPGFRGVGGAELGTDAEQILPLDAKGV